MKTPRGKNLYAFWGTKLAQRVNALSVGHSDPILVNLASIEYAAAIDREALTVPVLDIDFKEWRGDKLKIISFFAKKARGQMARFLIENRIETREGLRAFDLDGYAFDADRSTEDRWLFTRRG
jgi:cytoplasmic iron level regulating protein YaaA (DUF328/UPF0246 family)